MKRVLSFLAFCLLLAACPALAAGPACGVPMPPASGATTPPLDETGENPAFKGVYSGKMAVGMGSLCIDIIVEAKGKNPEGSPFVTVIYLSDSGVRGTRSLPAQTLPLKDGKKFTVKLPGVACPNEEMDFELMAISAV